MFVLSVDALINEIPNPMAPFGIVVKKSLFHRMLQQVQHHLVKPTGLDVSSLVPQRINKDQRMGYEVDA